MDLADWYDPVELDEAFDNLLSPFGLFTSLDFAADGSRLFVGAGCRLYVVDAVTGQVEAATTFVGPGDEGEVFDPSHGEIRVLGVQECAAGVCCVRLEWNPPPGNQPVEFCQLVESGLRKFVMADTGRRLSWPELTERAELGDPILAPSALSPHSMTDAAYLTGMCVAERAGLVAITDSDGDDNHRLAIFRADTAALLRTLPGYPDGAWWMDLDPTAARLAILEDAEQVNIIDTHTGQSALQVPLAPGIGARCRFSVDGSTLFIAATKPAQLIHARLDASAPGPHRLAIGHDDALQPLCLTRSGGSVWAPTEPVNEYEDVRMVAIAATAVVLADPARGARTHPIRPATRRRGPVALCPSGDLFAYTVDTTLVIDRTTPAT